MIDYNEIEYKEKLKELEQFMLVENANLQKASYENLKELTKSMPDLNLADHLQEAELYREFVTFHNDIFWALNRLGVTKETFIKFVENQFDVSVEYIQKIKDWGKENGLEE